MRYIIIPFLASLVMAGVVARAETPTSADADKNVWTNDLPVVSTKCTDAFPSLPILAARLGVVPQHDLNGVGLRMCNGNTYDLLQIITATLNRLDAASK